MDIATESLKEKRPKTEFVRRVKSVLVISVLTAVTLTGSVILAFWAIDLNVHILQRSSDLVRIVVGLLGLFSSLLLGGVLWGAGVAWWIGEAVRGLATAAGKGWTGMAFLFALLLEVVNGMQTLIGQALRLTPPVVLTASFAVAVFFVVLVAVRKLWAKIDTAYSSRKVGLACAGAAVIGYVLFDWYMQQQGCVLGSSHACGVSVMVTVMKAGLTGAALSGGAVLGWFLGGGHNRPLVGY